MRRRDPDRPVSSYELSVLNALQGEVHIYAGTVPQATIDRNRRRNKAARKQRKINAKNGSRHGVR